MERDGEVEEAILSYSKSGKEARNLLHVSFCISRTC